MKMVFGKKKGLQMFLFVFIAFVVLGIGYAAISAINLTITGNAVASGSNDAFKVIFTSANLYSYGTASIDNNDKTLAYMNVTGLTQKGDTAVAYFTVKNDSNGVGANIELQLTNSNTDYFKVTSKLDRTQLRAGDVTTVRIIVELKSTPVEADASTSISCLLHATPIEEANATGTASAVIMNPMYTYTIGANSIGQSVDHDFINFSSAKTKYGHSVANAHVVDNGVITESYIAYERDNQLFHIRGGVDETGDDSYPIYEENVRIAKESAGSDWANYCSEDTFNNNPRFTCTFSDYHVTIEPTGNLFGGGGSWRCYVYSNGISSCN